MNKLLNKLQPYPFERLRGLLAGVTPNAALSPVNLSIGEPKHPTPPVVTEALTAAFGGLSQYPATAGSESLRSAIAAWIGRRYAGVQVDPAREVLPVNGSREALFAFAQTVIEGGPDAIVISPNPFYQIYEGAALLAGATPWYLEQSPEHDFRCDWDSVPDDVWRRTRLLFVCSPGNPTGKVMRQSEWEKLFALSDRHGFIIAADECYSEIHFDEAAPPLGALEAAQRCGRTGFPRLVVFSSLSKRSNVPGMRSGFVAGDAELLKAFLLYRTYHGSAMSGTFQAASVAAWNDEAHVLANRQQYRAKFEAVAPLLQDVLDAPWPEAGFYFWAGVPGGDDATFVRDLYEQYNVLTLPGSYLAREAHGRNPGAGRIRLALVEPLEQCVLGARRLREFVLSRQSK